MGSRILVLKNSVLSKKFLAYFFVISLGFIALASKYYYNGLVFEFDYGLYQPDGKYYTYMALDFIYNNPKQSAQSVVDWYAIHGYKGNIFEISDIIPQTSPVYEYISHRVLYPIISTPFVYLFNIPGMLVIPAISFLVLLLIVQKISNDQNLIFLGVCICILLTSSPTVIRWMFWNGTDPLLTGLFSYVVLLLHKIKNNPSQKNLQLFLLVFLTSATRFSLVFWIAIAIVIFINGKKILGLLLVFTASLFSLPALISTLSVSILPAEKNLSTMQKVFDIPQSLIKVLSIDIAQLAVLDRLLLIFLVSGLIISLFNLNSIQSQYFIAILVAGYILGAINGTVGVNLRYQLPAIPFCAWSIIVSWTQIRVKLKTHPFLRAHIKV